MKSTQLLLADRYVRVEGLSSVRDLSKFLRPLIVDEVQTPPAETLTVKQNEENYLCERSNGDTSPYFTTREQGDFLLLFERTLLNLYLEYLPVNSLVFHASGFYDGGRLFGFLGAPNSGKTTVAEQFLDRFDYVSDELIALQPGRKLLYPFPKPLNLDPNRRYDTVECLDVTDSDGRRFCYGIPGRACSIMRESKSVSRSYLFSLDRTRDTEPTLEELRQGDNFMRLLEHVLKPRGSNRAFNRLSEFNDTTLNHYELRYEDTDQLADLGLFNR